MLGANMKSILLIGAFLVAGVLCQDGANKTTLTPKERMFSFLQVLKFPNDVCAGTNSRNGTCYSSDECTAKGGVNSGSCANGFGVCCTFVLSCGQSSSENNTYLILGATTAPSPSVCTYTLCENNPNICRLRLDFNTFVINGPFVGSARASGAAAGNVDPGSIGDCLVDTFSVSAPGNRATPVICGTNSQQHMYIDTSNGCAKATFDFGAAATSRQYEIKVTQYNCGDEMAGPPDCLQYHTAETGTIKSFNFNLLAGAVNFDATHLSNQQYSICFRRGVNKCTLCFLPSVNIAPFSFGLSASSAAMAAKSMVDATCISDYLQIPQGVGSAAIATNVAAGVASVTNGLQRICGRIFNSGATGQTTTNSICTGLRPFKVIFNTDANELASGTDDATVDEQAYPPAGIIGFSLDYTQGAC